uniref:Small ribosomal subunit protein bS20c n=1 Tax=Rhodomonas salina TaxID=3034 RepID=A6MVX5_RHDSA|nr:ribosomal protein S20 [Rhodomonas salina]ABO70810.1 30S ribosomal protein s20 [Rhodomonas salina]
MANTKSAEKRIQINERNRLRNKAYKSAIKTIYKKCLIAINDVNESNKATVNELLSLSYSKIDKAVQKGILHPNTGASKKSSLAKALKKVRSN